MISAFCEEEQRVVIPSIEELPHPFREYKWRCPAEDCQEKVTFVSEHWRDSNKWRAHFSHKPQTTCPMCSDREGETHQHINSKIFLANNISKTIQPRQVEGKKIGDHYPDLTIGKYAIEVQYSRISPENFWRRSTNYFLNDYLPVWIFADQAEITTSSGNFKSWVKEIYRTLGCRAFQIVGDNIYALKFKSGEITNRHVIKPINFYDWKTEVITFATPRHISFKNGEENYGLPF